MFFQCLANASLEGGTIPITPPTADGFLHVSRCNVLKRKKGKTYTKHDQYERSGKGFWCSLSYNIKVFQVADLAGEEYVEYCRLGTPRKERPGCITYVGSV